MMRGYIRSSPFFFHLIKIAMAALTGALIFLAVLFPAPLQEPATIALVPNPVRSAWFLLWIQELVSYSKYLIYLVLVMAAGCVALPWLSRGVLAEHAAWFRKEHLFVSSVSLVIVTAIGALTVIAMFFRGENWAFVLPF